MNSRDRFELIEKDTAGLKVSDITRLYARDKQNVSLLRRAIEVEAVPESWRDHFRNRLEQLTGS